MTSLLQNNAILIYLNTYMTDIKHPTRIQIAYSKRLDNTYSWYYYNLLLLDIRILLNNMKCTLGKYLNIDND